jgi:hypothetical protein
VKVQNLFFFILLMTLPARATTIYLPEDELILPPMLSDVMSSGLPEDRINVVGPDGRGHEAKKGEWLDFGDSVNLPGRLAMQIIQREKIQYVAGGVFTGKIGSGSTNVKEDFSYELTITRGWAKVWIKPDAAHSTLRIITDAGTFLASDGIFWISARPGHTEVYLFAGVLLNEGTKIPLANRLYAKFDKGSEKPISMSKDWDPSRMEVQIAASYPPLVKLATLAQEEWDSGKVAKTYAEIRKKGWRKASRF